MGKRNKYEIDAIVSIIKTQILDKRKKLAADPENQKMVNEYFKKNYEKGISEIENLNNIIQKAEQEKENLFRMLGRKAKLDVWKVRRSTLEEVSFDVVNKFKAVSENDIFNQVVIAGDEGADVIIKRISKMFS